MDGKAFHQGLGVIKVVHVEVGPNGRTERELTGEELEQWKVEHGFITEKQDKPDTEH